MANMDIYLLTEDLEHQMIGRLPEPMDLQEGDAVCVDELYYLVKEVKTYARLDTKAYVLPLPPIERAPQPAILEQAICTYCQQPFPEEELQGMSVEEALLCTTCWGVVIVQPLRDTRILGISHERLYLVTPQRCTLPEHL